MLPREQAASMRGRTRTVRATYVPPGRTTATVVTDSLATGEEWQGSIAMSPAYRVYAIETDKAARVRLYVDSDFQTADLSRAIGTDPADGTGVVLEYITADPALLEAWLSPVVDGIADNSDIAITVQNHGTAGAVTVTFIYIPVEQ